MVSMSYRDPVTKALIELPMGCAGGGSPVGFVGSYAGSVAPVGWVICDGRAHNSPALRTILGSDNTPDLRGRFILAASSTHAAKTSGGEETHTLTEAEIPSHAHGASSGTESVDHTHNMAYNSPWVTNYNEGLAGGAMPVVQPGGATPTASSGISANHTHGITVNPSGGGAAHNNMPPFYAMVYIIKAFAESANGGITQADADARYVNVSGDTMTGELAVNNHFRLSGALAKLPESADDAFTFYARPATGGLGPLVCANPTYSNQAATKGYVDTRIQAGYAWSDPGGLSSTQFPVAFAGLPLSIVITPIAGITDAIPTLRSSDASGFVFSVVNRLDIYQQVQVFWIAIGPVA